MNVSGLYLSVSLFTSGSPHLFQTALITISNAGVLLRSWSVVDGQLLWEHFSSSSASSSAAPINNSSKYLSHSLRQASSSSSDDQYVFRHERMFHHLNRFTGCLQDDSVNVRESIFIVYPSGTLTIFRSVEAWDALLLSDTDGDGVGDLLTLHGNEVHLRSGATGAVLLRDVKAVAASSEECVMDFGN